MAGTVEGHGAQVGLGLDDARPRRHAQITDGGSQVSPGGHRMAAAGALAGRRGIAPPQAGQGRTASAGVSQRGGEGSGFGGVLGRSRRSSGMTCATLESGL